MVHAQSTEEGGSNVDYSPLFRHITTSDGLPHVVVLDIAQDKEGFLWFATGDGLARYDGYEFVVYRSDPERTDSLTESNTSAIAVAPDGLIWVGTFATGLNAFDPRTERFVRYRHDPNVPTSLGSDVVRDVAPASDGTVWIGTVDGLDHFDPQSGIFTHYRNDPNDPTTLSHNDIQRLTLDEEGTLWIATYGGGLEALPPGSQAFTHHRHDPDDEGSISGDQLETVYVDRKGNIWAGVWNVGLSYLDRASNRFTNYQANPNGPTELGGIQVTDILEDREGALWITFRDDGINRLDLQTGQFHHYHPDPADSASLSDSSLESVFQDQAGSLWFGTSGSGLSILDPYRKPFKLYRNYGSDPTSLSASPVQSIWVTDEQLVWVGTYGAGLNRLDLTTGLVTRWIHDPTDDTSLSNNVVFALSLGADGTLWVGTWNGLDRYDPETDSFVHYRYDPDDPTSLSDNTIYSLFEDSQGVLWVGTYNGINRLDAQSGGFTHYNHDPDRPETPGDTLFMSIYEDRAGDLWFGTRSAGLERFDRDTETFTHFPPNPADPNAISEGVIIAIHEDQAGRLWAGTWTGGLNLYEPETGRFTHFRERDGLISDRIHGIAEEIDANGESILWISTARGLSRFDPQTRTFRNYDQSDGLPDTAFIFRAYFQTPDSRIYFGSPSGLVTFMPDQIKEETAIPPLVLTKFFINNEPVQIGEDSLLQEAVDLTDTITLPSEQQRFSIQFAALDFRQPQALRYRYMLSDFDKEWVEVDSSRRIATYTNLDPGNYRFRVRSSNRDGVWSDTSRTLSIIVEPQWWQRWSVRGSALVLLIGFLFALYQVRVRALQAYGLQLERQVDERTQELASVMTVARELVSNLDLDALLNQILLQMGHVLPYDAALVMMQETGALAVRALHIAAVQKELDDIYIPVERYGFLATALEDGNPHEIPRISADTCVQEFVQLYLGKQFADGSLLYAPLAVKGANLGLLFVSRLQPNAFRPSDSDELQQYANFVAIALENARLYSQAREQATEQERIRLAQDLHDSVTQTIFSTSLIADVLPKRWRQDPAEAEQNLEQLRLLTRAALAEMRTLLIELRPSSIRLFPLGQLLTQLTEASTGRNALPSQFYIENVPVLSEDVQYVFYRIAQEALNNVNKHAQASEVKVSLSATPPILDDSLQEWHGAISMTIADNGKGFDTDDQPKARAGLGLRIMQERADSIGATLTIHSVPGQGTELTLVWRR